MTHCTAVVTPPSYTTQLWSYTTQLWSRLFHLCDGTLHSLSNVFELRHPLFAGHVAQVHSPAIVVLQRRLRHLQPQNDDHSNYSKAEPNKHNPPTFIPLHCSPHAAGRPRQTQSTRFHSLLFIASSSQPLTVLHIVRPFVQSSYPTSLFSQYLSMPCFVLLAVFHACVFHSSVFAGGNAAEYRDSTTTMMKQWTVEPTS